MKREDTVDIAIAKILAGIEDEAVAARYPNRTHFVAADHPEHGSMAEGALAEGKPVVIVFPDGKELLIQPNGAEAPRIEARDASGQPIAA